MKLILFLSLLSSATAIWPAPKSYTNGSSVVWINEHVQFTYNGANVRSDFSEHFPYVYPFSTCENDTERFFLSQLHKRTGPHGGSGGHHGCVTEGGCHGGKEITSQAVVEAAVKRAKETIFNEEFVPWKFHPRNTIQEHEPASRGTAKTYLKTLSITQTGTDEPSTFKPLAGKVDESYNLTIGTDGSAALTAVSSTGILRGLETFTQLWYLHSRGKSVGYYMNTAPVSIQDAPRWKHRGLNLDLSRNWMGKDQVFRQIDALAWNKFNRLHIHMTDAQSWPMDIPSMPELSEKGAYQTGLSYSPQDVEDFHTYAIYRGVEIYIEFDMPGHTSSIAYSHPELITAFRAEPWDYYCAEPPCGALKMNSTPVYDFLEKLWNDVLPRLSPYTAYFHTGGDEVNRQDFMLDETVRSNETDVLRPLLQKFVDFNHKKVRENGLVPVVWEEMALEPWNLDLGKDVIVQTWQTDEALFNATRDGYQALFGNYNFWYLDCGRGQWLNFENGPSFQRFYPFLDYCNPLKNWRLIYSYDPTRSFSQAQKDLVLGGEMHIWAESTDSVNLDTMIWPRGAAAGEVLWSGRTDESGMNRSQVEAAPRLSEWRERLVSRGVQAGPVQMVYCTQYGGKECDLELTEEGGPVLPE